MLIKLKLSLLIIWSCVDHLTFFMMIEYVRS